ncbi:hypothetical protein G6M87_24275 [Rhizobium rhizogenes]|uniref:sugar-transfer associated ATP-grasp domain-containing protein n=1 Tax=Rhizobium rhizogenes TaxID=359 RepID=UPI00157168B4|nr:sugar-transfer associated ATP-grasp domain-containing protein [Rhizobium rhizogenes]NTI26699.1 hypothetical protein [Rhizobium rhizogenes]QTG08610.1 hypothetical protein G6M87_24275 [Rhizobium rhizogenes]
MAKRLNAFEDQQTKEKGLRPPEIDLEFHRKLADQSAGKGHWEDKLKEALEGPAQLTETEFYAYELYKPEVSAKDIAAYIGKVRQKELYKVCNSPYWLAISEDKALFELLLKGAGLSAAKTIAIFSQVQRWGFDQQLHSKEDLRDFLAKQSFPIFCKPIDGMMGIGAMKIAGFDGHKVSLSENDTQEFQDFYHYITHLTTNGFVFQRCIDQEQTVSELFGPDVCAVRFLVLNRSAPCIESAVLRSAGGGAALDHRWQKGNIFAAINADTGEITNAIMQSDGIAFESVENNPATGSRLLGAILPYWQEAVELVLRAATLLPDVRTQSWDIAISRSGPVALEFNWGGSVAMLQFAHKRGILSSAFEVHLEACKHDPLYIHPVH